MANVAWLVNAVTGAPEYSGRTVRQAMSVALGGATAARPLGARSGVRPGTPTTTVALPTSTSYVIHPHAGVLDTQASASAGPYWYAIPADETGTVNAAHATWPRKDILWVRIDDPSEAGTAPPAIVTGYTVGTAATPGTQVPPATPAQAMRLATISVPQSGGGAPTIVFDAPRTAAAGAPIPVWSQAERDALDEYDGLAVYRLDTHQVEVWNGTRWGDGTFVPLVDGYTAGDYSVAAMTTASVTFTAATGRTYRISAGLIGTQVTATGTPTVKLLVDTVDQWRLATGTSYAASSGVYGIPAHYVLVGDGASHTVAVTVQTNAGVFRLAASGVNQLVVEQIA